MNISLVHNKDQQGTELIQYFQDQWDEVQVKESSMKSQTFLIINARYGDKSTEVYNFNPLVALKYMHDEKKVQEMLEANRIFSMNPEDIAIKSYDVFLLDGEIISIRQSTGSRKEKDVRYIKSPFSSQVTKMARETAYFLNLDYAMVTIVQTNKKNYRFKKIHASPLLRKYDLNKVFSYFEILKKRVPSPKKGGVKLGADPEFMISNTLNGKMIPASLFYSKEGQIGCDSVRTTNRQHYPVAELRPDPDTSPLVVLDNLRNIMVKANRMAPYKNIKWIAGSLPFPGFTTGGHIHFSNITFNHHLLRALDNYIGLPLFMIEDPVTGMERRKKYGFLADYRKKNYGGFEYRTIASWLIDPDITAAVLCLAKVVASHYHLLKSDFLMIPSAIKAFYQGDREYFRHDINQRMYNELNQLPLYSEWAEYIDLIFSMIRNYKSWDESVDMRITWNLNTDFGSLYRGQRKTNRDNSTNSGYSDYNIHHRNPHLNVYGRQQNSFYNNPSNTWSTSILGGYMRS